MEKDEDLTIPGDRSRPFREDKGDLSTGHCGLLERLRAEFPPAVTELLKVPRSWPKRVKHLYHDLNVRTIEQLYQLRARAEFAP